MSNGDGGMGFGGLLAFCLFCYFTGFLGIPVGLALIGVALLWVWYAFLAVFGLIVTITAFAVVAEKAVKARDRWLMFDLAVAPLATIWPAILCREPVRDFYVSLFHGPLVILVCAFLFIFLILGLPIGIFGMLMSMRELEDGTLVSGGPAGAVIRLFTSYLPLFLFYTTWAAIILNSVSPKK